MVTNRGHERKNLPFYFFISFTENEYNLIFAEKEPEAL